MLLRRLLLHVSVMYCPGITITSLLSRAPFRGSGGARGRPRSEPWWGGSRFVSGSGVTDPKSRLLWGVRPVTLDLRAVPALSSRARDVYDVGGEFG